MALPTRAVQVQASKQQCYCVLFCLLLALACVVLFSFCSCSVLPLTLQAVLLLLLWLQLSFALLFIISCFLLKIYCYTCIGFVQINKQAGKQQQQAMANRVQKIQAEVNFRFVMRVIINKRPKFDIKMEN